MKSFFAGAIAFVAALGIAGSALALPAPDEVIKSATGELQADIAKNFAKYKSDKPAFYKMVDGRIVQYFDTPYIAQLILARNWKTASADQRTRFEVAFKNMLIRSYADAMLQYYDSVKADIKPAQVAPDAKQATVSTNLLRKDGPPLPMAFDMRVKDDAWKIYDIKVENLSLIGNFRSQVAAQIKASSLDAVIAKLESGEAVVAPPSGGAAGGSP